MTPEERTASTAKRSGARIFSIAAKPECYDFLKFWQYCRKAN
jgi:hypothetical protein